MPIAVCPIFFTKKRGLLYFMPMEKHEKEGFYYILGVVVLIAAIVGLASLTHVILP
jgi:hypothetical protein